MTPASNPVPGAPKHWLLRLARLVFEEPTLSSVVHPAIADIEHELNALDGIGDSPFGITRLRRLRVWLRGLWSLARVLAVVAYDAPPPDRTMAVVGASRAHDLVSAVLLTVFFLGFAVATPATGWFTSGALITGVLFAMGLHRWYRFYAGHPEVDPMARSRPVEINFASIPVGGNAAGLVVAAGSVLILVIGLPEFAWFLALAIGGGVVLATSIRMWRSAHPFTTRPANSIAHRA